MIMITNMSILSNAKEAGTNYIKSAIGNANNYLMKKKLDYKMQTKLPTYFADNKVRSEIANNIKKQDYKGAHDLVKNSLKKLSR